MKWMHHFHMCLQLLFFTKVNFSHCIKTRMFEWHSDVNKIEKLILFVFHFKYLCLFFFFFSLQGLRSERPFHSLCSCITALSQLYWEMLLSKHLFISYFMWLPEWHVPGELASVNLKKKKEQFHRAFEMLNCNVGPELFQTERRGKCQRRFLSAKLVKSALVVASRGVPTGQLPFYSLRFQLLARI